MATPTITLIATMTMKPECEDEFVEFAQRLQGKVAANEPGVMLYALHRHPDRPHTYVWVERYRDSEALAAHGSASYVVEAMTLLPEWLAAPPELLQLTELSPA